MTIKTLPISFNPLPYEKILDLSNLRAFADDKINVTQNLKFPLGREESIVGKGENAGYQHFLLFPQCFQKVSFSESLKVWIVWQRVNGIPNKPLYLRICSTSPWKTLWYKGEIAYYEQFLFFTQNFLPFLGGNLHYFNQI